MFWPDETVLSQQSWWTEPAWDKGPGYGQLVEALRPALRAALLLGWQVDSIEVATGRATNETTEWMSIELTTLELEPAKPLDVDKPFDGPNVHLGVFEITDLHGRINDVAGAIVDGTFAIPIAIPVFGSNGLPQDGKVPQEIADGVEAFVDEAIDELLSTMPSSPVLPAPRAIQQGLLWMLFTSNWRGLSTEAKFAADDQVLALREDPAGYLLGELSGRPVSRPPEGFWVELASSLQARGEAHRLPQRVRLGLPSMPWLDALGELISRGAVIVPGLVEQDEPPEPIEVVPLERTPGFGEPITEITLSIWGGDAEITLRRVLVFGDDGKDDVETSVAWDYVPGDAQQRPMVVVVAGRGVGIEHDPEVVLTGRSAATEADERGAETARIAGHDHLDDHDRIPVLAWDLLVHRVQDDNLIKQLGAAIDPVTLLANSLIEPDPPFYINGPISCLKIVPKHDGVLLQFPGHGSRSPTNTPVSSTDIPRVVELTIDDPCSGTTAWTADAHFFPYTWGSYSRGLVHLCVWVSEGVSIHTEDSAVGCEQGSPSSISTDYWKDAWMYSAELWEADKPEKLPRPFSAVLPVTTSTAIRPDLVDALPILEFDGELARHDGITLTPAWHCYRQYGYRDSLGFLLLDIFISLIPFVGDAADIGEAIWAWQRGRDKWGRPVSDFEVTFLIICAAVPIVSIGFIRGLSRVLARPVTSVPTAELGRLAVPARWADDVPLDQVEALRAIEDLTRRPGGDLDSPALRAKAELAIRGLNADATAIRAFAERLAAGRAAGLPTVGDVLSQGGDGLSVGPLQTAFLRHLRDHVGATDSPEAYVELLVRGRP